jgi:hypothetical protein
VIESEKVPASFEMAETRWPAEQRKTSIQLGGSNVPAVELTALSFGLTIAMRHPLVDEVEPG